MAATNNEVWQSATVVGSLLTWPQASGGSY